ncbi:hypothetical protein JKF63_05213 [Porcisia hertigi]|uniref:Uncharacterized protein n=1 Tax=Porcisia hertigi TaxID=2761500 RepID=A0A836LGU9_9TRYP|nr:hypothetical protein JKF63_05213 [Porcisia hertigi]
MPLKKKEEVCGKPNQYNLKTLEYDWKELPDNHIQVPPQRPRVRDYSALAGCGAAGPKVNPITNQHLPSPSDGARARRDVSPTPLPSPSRPVQEALRLRSSPQTLDCKRDHVAEILGGRGYNGVEQAPSNELKRGARPSPLVDKPVQTAPFDQHLSRAERQIVLPYPLPSALEDSSLAQAHAGAAASEQRVVEDLNLMWSHEDIKRVVSTNILEAQRSYLR